MKPRIDDKYQLLILIYDCKPVTKKCIHLFFCKATYLAGAVRWQERPFPTASYVRNISNQTYEMRVSLIKLLSMQFELERLGEVKSFL